MANARAPDVPSTTTLYLSLPVTHPKRDQHPRRTSPTLTVFVEALVFAHVPYMHTRHP